MTGAVADHRQPVEAGRLPWVRGGEHWAEALIGIPWAADGEGPGLGADPDWPDLWSWSFNCRSFFAFVQSRVYLRAVPELGDADPEDDLAIRAAFERLVGLSGWQQTDRPAEGDAVIMGMGRKADHLGVWLSIDGGGVLHCPRGHGVGFHAPHVLKLQGFAVLGYYTPPFLTGAELYPEGAR